MYESDQECVRLCRNGHHEAYRQLVQRYQAPLLSYLVAGLGDLERAEETAQETFVRAFFGLRKLKKTGSFFPWLVGIAARVVREQRRAEQRYRRTLSAAPSPDADARTARDGGLERALALLPRPYAEVVLLRFYGNLSCVQVADRLGIPLGTVTKRLSRAYRLLRESLDPCGYRHGRSEVKT